MTQEVSYIKTEKGWKALRGIFFGEGKTKESAHLDLVLCETLNETEWPENLCIEQKEWDQLDEKQKQFARDADKGGFIYAAENGKIWAMGAKGTQNLFSMDVEFKYESEGTVYWPK